MPKTIMDGLVLAVIAVHLAIAIVEMLLWNTRFAASMHRELGLSEDEANKVAPIVANAGLYNAFLAVGLIWGYSTNTVEIIRLFVICVIVAGIFGFLTLRSWKPLAIQSVPGAIALLFVWNA